MKEQLARLYQLQLIDSALAQHKAWIADLDDGTRVGQKLAAAQAELTHNQKRLHDLEAANRSKELELKSADEERQTKSKRAYGGAVADPKELGALERKIEELKRKSDHLEDELLGLMEQIETLREEVAKQQRIVASGTKVYEQTRADYAQARGKLEEKMKELLAQRQELAPQIDAALLKEYDALRVKMEGIAVSGVDGNLCQTCRNVLPQSTLTQLKMGKTIVKCQNCRRILYPSDAW
ncbi:MAG: zinc ribbon domain-containing protein [Bacteroidota bacterium]